jgi:hypothetical protein
MEYVFKPRNDLDKLYFDYFKRAFPELSTEGIQNINQIFNDVFLIDSTLIYFNSYYPNLGDLLYFEKVENKHPKGSIMYDEVLDKIKFEGLDSLSKIPQDIYLSSEPCTIIPEYSPVFKYLLSRGFDIYILVGFGNPIKYES